MMPAIITANAPNQSITLAINQSIGPLVFPVNRYGAVNINAMALGTTSTSTWKALATLTANNRQLSNVPIPIQGNDTGDLFPARSVDQFFLPEPLFIDEHSVFTMELNALAALTAVTPVLIADRLPRAERVNSIERAKTRTPYWYGIDSGCLANVAAGDTGTGYISIDGRHSFLLYQISALGLNGRVFRLQITDLSTGRSLAQAPGQQNYIGRSLAGRRFSTPVVCYNGMKLQVQAINDGATTTDIYVTLAGVAIASGRGNA